MQQEEKSTTKKKWLLGIAIYAVVFLAILLIANSEDLKSWFGKIISLFRPVLFGLILAYLCNPFFRFYERKLLCRLRPPSLRRCLSLILTYLTLLLIIALLFLLIMPQLIESIVAFVKDYDSYLDSLILQINRIFAALNSFLEKITKNPTTLEYINLEDFHQKTSAFFGNNATNLPEFIANTNFDPFFNILSNTVSVIADIVFGFFISLYFLATKEKRYAQVMKVRRALFSAETNVRITRFCTIADRSFGGFLEGKIFDSLIIGILTYIVISIFRIPYAVLVATFVGVTNVIPVVGPFIGAIPTAFIILLTDPSKVIPFLIIVLLVQQLDGNIIGPAILGNNTGVSSLCVIIAICTMGSMFGFTGMIIGVPLFATILELADDMIQVSLQKKGKPIGVENYYAPDAAIDPVKQTDIGTDKLIRRFEKHILHLNRRMESEEGYQPTRRDRSLLRLHRILYRLRLISDPSIDTLTQFSVEEALRDAKKAAAERKGMSTGEEG